MTFRAFAKQASDAATQNAVLIQATQCTFAPQMTGYSSQKPESNYSPIIEIVRSLSGDKK